MKYYRIFETAYLVIAILASIETYREWNLNRERAYLFLLFAVIAIFMFFFRRHYRKKFQARQNQK